MQIIPRLIRCRDAANYLGMCRDVFNRDVRPFIVEIPISSRGVAFDRLDLDAYATYLKNTKGKPSSKHHLWGQPELPEAYIKPIAKNNKKKSSGILPMKSAREKGSPSFERALAMCSKISQTKHD